MKELPSGIKLEGGRRGYWRWYNYVEDVEVGTIEVIWRGWSQGVEVGFGEALIFKRDA